MLHFARFTAALALASAILSTPAHAAAAGDARSLAVQFADLRLDSPFGRATLMRRIDHAARFVCGRPDPRDLVAMRLANRCYAGALDATMPQVQLALAGASRRQLAAIPVPSQGL